MVSYKKVVLMCMLLCLKECFGCPVGWLQYDGKCFMFSNAVDSFAGAESMCTAMHGKLAEPRTQAEIDFITGELNHVDFHGNPYYWIGVHDVVIENRWQYLSDDEQVTLTNWNPGEPNGKTGENCVITVSTGGKWADVTCFSQRHYICERNDQPSAEVIG